MKALRSLALLLGACTVLAACAADVARVKVIRDGTPNTAAWQLLTEHWTEPKLAVLARSERLLEVVAERESELDAVLRLAAWSSRQWPAGVPEPYPKSNALDILGDIRAGRTSGFCGQYAYVLADVMKAVGFFAVRYVETFSREDRGHFTVEVWIDELQSWVLIDPMYAVYYRGSDGRPLSSLDLHDVAVQETWDEAAPVLLRPRPQDDRGFASLPHGGVGGFYHLAVSLRSDYLRHPRPVTVRERFASFLAYADPRVPATERASAYLLSSSSRKDFAWPVNQVYVETVSVDRDGAVLRLTSRRTTPNLRGFEVSVDGGEWRPLDGTTVHVSRGARVEARAVNAAGHRGRPSIVKVL